MRKSLAGLAFAAALGAAGSACAMKPQASNAVSCTVVGAEKLPAALGGTEALCEAIRAAAAPALGASVTVEVIDSYTLAATATTAAGRALPEQRVASSDRTLGAGSVRMLAKALADQLAAAR